MTSGVRERRPRRWRQDPDGRRARVLEAAAQELAARGVRARVADVAVAAGVAEGTVYHLFGSKRALLAAVGERYGRGLARAAFGGLDLQADAPTPEHVASIVRNIFAYVRETPGPLVAFLLSTEPGGAAPGEGSVAQDANRGAMVAAIEAVLLRWSQREGAPPMQPRIAAEIQFGLVESALRDCFLRRGGADLELYVAEVTRSLAAMLGARPLARRATSESVASVASAASASVTPRGSGNE